MTPSTYLSFIKGYDAFPCKTTVTTNPSVIFDAVKTKDCAKVKQLLLSDGDINVVNTSGSSLCHEAVRTGEMAMLETVLAFHPDINSKESAIVGGSTPLHAAAAQGSLDMVKLLLRFDADPASRDSAVGSTPLHIAARHGHRAICETLLEAGRTRPGLDGDQYGDLLDSQGKKAYYWAREFGHFDIAELLPPQIYDALAQLDINRRANPVWGPSKGKKKAAGGKKGKGKGKDAKKKK